MSLLKSGVDTYVLYRIIRRISTPFRDWDAYKLGVINDRGEFLIDKSKRTREQINSLTYFDIFVMNLKKTFQKIPGGNNKYLTYGAALWLIREDKYIKMDLINEDGEVIANTSTNNIARSDAKEASAFKKKARNPLK